MLTTSNNPDTAPNQTDMQYSVMFDANTTARGVLMRLAGARGDLTPAEITKWQGVKTLAQALQVASEMRPDLPILKTLLDQYTASTSGTKDAHFTDVILKLHGQAGFYSERTIGDMYHNAHAFSYGGTGSTDSPETMPGTGRPTLHFVEDLQNVLPDSNPNPGMDGKRVLYNGSTVAFSGSKSEVLEYIFVVEKVTDLAVTVWGGEGTVTATVLKDNVAVNPVSATATPLVFKNLAVGDYVLRLTGTTDFEHVLINVRFTEAE